MRWGADHLNIRILDPGFAKVPAVTPAATAATIPKAPKRIIEFANSPEATPITTASKKKKERKATVAVKKRLVKLFGHVKLRCFDLFRSFT